MEKPRFRGLSLLRRFYWRLAPFPCIDRGWKLRPSARSRWAVMCASVTGAREASGGGPTRMLAYFALVNNTASLWSVPRASAMNFPSGDQP